MEMDADKLYERAKEADETNFSVAAVVLLEKFLMLQPQNNMAQFRYAQNLLRVGRLSDAEKQLLALSKHPLKKQWLVDLALGEIETTRGNLRKAEAYFREALEKNAESTVPSVYLAGALAHQERFEEACEVLSNALRAEGDLDELYLNLGNNKAALGDYASARKCYLRALEFSSEHYKDAEQALQDLDFLAKTDLG